jgi:hypothetical protein
MIVLRESLAKMTCFLLSFRYLSTSSFPPPGLYSPNCEMKAMLLLMLTAEFQLSLASKNASSLSGSRSMFFTFANTLSIWKSGS